jgi:hypothetical protein
MPKRKMANREMKERKIWRKANSMRNKTTKDRSNHRRLMMKCRLDCAYMNKRRLASRNRRNSASRRANNRGISLANLLSYR